MQSQKRVNKLYYNRYICRLEMKNILSGIFRNRNTSYAKSVIDSLNNVIDGRTEPFTSDELKYKDLPMHIKYAITEISLHKFRSNLDDAKLVLHYLDTTEDCKVRVDYPRNISLYSMQREDLQELSNKLYFGSTLYAPTLDDEKLLLSEPNIELVQTPPKYLYKCYFNYRAKHLESFASWCEANRSKIKITDNLIGLLKKGYLVDGHTFHVKNDKVLTMVKLIIGDGLGRVKKLVCNDKYIYGNEQ